MTAAHARTITIAIAFALISLVPSFVAIGLIANEVNDRCEDSRINRLATRETLLESMETLGYRHDPETGGVVPDGSPIDYYATHPIERAEALSRTLAGLSRFPEITCDHWWDF